MKDTMTIEEMNKYLGRMSVPNDFDNFGINRLKN